MPHRGAAPAVITDAELSYDDQFRLRRRRYLIMMSLRIPCLVLAAVFWQTPWLAILIIAISIPLPWIAVLVANDRPATKDRRVRTGVINQERALSPSASVTDVVDAPLEAPDAAAGDPDATESPATDR